MNCQEFEELSGAYALDALTEEERRAADEHLAQCPKCSRALQQLRSVVELFPLTVPPVEPSPRVKERILARIEEQAQQQRLSQIQPASPAQAGSRFRQRAGKRWRWAALAAVAVLLLSLLGGSLAWNISLQQQLSHLQQQVALLGSPEAPVVYSLRGTALASSARGEVMYFPRQQVTVVVVYGLPPLQGTHVYQGWLLRHQRPTSIGLLTVKNGVATLNFQGPLAGYDSLAISLENGPQPSLNTPKGPVVALGTLISSQTNYHG
ncbi:MAG: anti-sigma factor [Thermogemmatispora sp.]|uniref:anti-sigma factor n=1 Tax=Thermogemmatispora sp. TaxID=1968838 RepID=UPI00261A3A5F|nr:anti-sigma factor [Thermogemmatispora sp.]MBX5456157.1 anti-sigma factor [Thermogemmatispora sp.]